MFEHMLARKWPDKRSGKKKEKKKKILVSTSCKNPNRNPQENAQVDSFSKFPYSNSFNVLFQFLLKTENTLPINLLCSSNNTQISSQLYKVVQNAVTMLTPKPFTNCMII